MRSKDHEENGYGHGLNFLIISHKLCVSYPPRSGCIKKSIWITYIYLSHHDHYHLSGTCNISPLVCQHHMPITTSSYLPNLLVTSTHRTSKVWGCYLVCFSCSLTSTIRFTQQILTCCINRSMMKHQQKSDWKWDLPIFTCDYWKCMFVVSLTKYTTAPNCVYYCSECEVVNKIQRPSLTFSSMCLYDVCSLIITMQHTNQIYGFDEKR